MLNAFVSSEVHAGREVDICVNCKADVTPRLRPSLLRRTLVEVMLYQFDPLIHRMVDKWGWSEVDAQLGFEDLKRFLYLASVSPVPVAPTKKLDELWHNFILFTQEYYEFCNDYLGGFINHRPRRRDDQKSSSGSEATVKMASLLFGELSSNWSFTENSIALSGATPPDDIIVGTDGCLHIKS